MPTLKARRRSEAKSEISVALSDSERTTIGSRLLGIKDGAQRTKVLSELTSALSRWASELGNAPNVLLRSDLIAHYEPLAKDAARLRKRLESTSPEVIGLANTLGIVNVGRLETALKELQEFGAWLRSEPSKKGGERRAFEKSARQTTQATLEWWYVRQCQMPPDERKKGDAARFTKIAMKAVDRAIRTAKNGSPNTGAN